MSLVSLRTPHQRPINLHHTLSMPTIYLQYFSVRYMKYQITAWLKNNAVVGYLQPATRSIPMKPLKYKEIASSKYATCCFDRLQHDARLMGGACQVASFRANDC